MCKCVNLQQWDIQFDENEFHETSKQANTHKKRILSNLDSDSDKGHLVFEGRNFTVSTDTLHSIDRPLLAWVKCEQQTAYIFSNCTKIASPLGHTGNCMSLQNFSVVLYSSKGKRRYYFDTISLDQIYEFILIRLLSDQFCDSSFVKVTLVSREVSLR